MNKNIKFIEKNIKNPKKGLPEDFFLFISRVTPLVCVDLLIKNKKNQTLLTWRKKGEKSPAGWHVPGGIIRFKEKIFDRIKKVAKNELNAKVVFGTKPIAINEINLNQKNRSHVISFLFLCNLKKKLSNDLKFINKNPKVGQWSWFNKVPKELIPPHRIYKNFFKHRYKRLKS